MESSECHREASSLLQSTGRRLQILWELAASDGIQRMTSRDKLAPAECGASLADPVGAGLPAMEFSECHREASSLLQSTGRRLQILWELACQRWNPANAIARQARSYKVRGVACRSCGSWLASDGIQRMPSRGKLAPTKCGVSLVAPVGAGLPAMGFSECHRETSSLLQSAGVSLADPVGAGLPAMGFSE